MGPSLSFLLLRWEDRCDAIVRLEKARSEAARDVTRDEVKFKFPEVLSNNAVCWNAVEIALSW